MSRATTKNTSNDLSTSFLDAAKTSENANGAATDILSSISNSTVALEGFSAFHSALNDGVLDAATRERIGRAIAQVNDCRYYPLHPEPTENTVKLTRNEITKNQLAGSTDAKANEAVKFAAEIAINRGKVSHHFIEGVRSAGYSDGEIIEIIAHVGLNTLTHYFSNVLDLEAAFSVESTSSI